MQVPVRNMAGETVGEIELRDRVFGIEPNVAVMYQRRCASKPMLAWGRTNQDALSEVRWSQAGAKHTGRARQGDSRPQWRVAARYSARSLVATPSG